MAGTPALWGSAYRCTLDAQSDSVDTSEASSGYLAG